MPVGETEAMLRGALQSKAERVVIVAHTMEFARYLQRRLQAMSMPAQLEGERFTFTTPSHLARTVLGRHGYEVFVDHAALGNWQDREEIQGVPLSG